MLHILAVIGISALLHHSNVQSACYFKNVSVSCRRNVILAIDVTSNINRIEGLEEEFYFIEDWVIPQLDIRDGYVSVGMTAYGTGELNLYDFTSNRKDLCSHLDLLYDTIQVQNTTKNVPLARTIRNLYNNFGFNSTSLVLFTATSNQSDVDNTAHELYGYINSSLANGFSIVVVNYGNCSFYSWPRNQTAVYAADRISYRRLSKEIDDSICDTIYTIPTTMTSANYSTTTTPSNPILSTNYSACNCEYNKIWLDIFLLIDSSTAMGRSGLDEATNFVVSALAKLTIGQASEYNTRLGVIAYASNVRLINDLNYFNSTSQLFDLEIPFLDEPGTNIERAISLAVNRFQSRYHRENTKQMIILVASTFNSGGWTDPTQIAEIFKEDGGVIATIAYDQIHGAVVPLLNTLATPFYNITNTDYSSEDLRFLLCEANCFCPKNYLPYNMDFWGAPQGGCYNPITIPAINYLAVRYCSKHDNSILSIVENENKNNWLKRVFPSRTKFWIGLKYINGQWVWPNGYRLNYANWGPGEPNLQNGDCVYMRQYSGFNFAWFTDDCTNDWNYVCQAKPCDSTNFCRDM